MVCLGVEPGAAGWKAQTNPLSYGGTPPNSLFDYGTDVNVPNSKYLEILG